MMKLKIIMIATVAGLLNSCASQRSEVSYLDQFERISAAQAGYSQEALNQLADYLEHSGSSSMILLYDGKVVFEWGDIYKKHSVHSIRKSLLNSLMGSLYDKGLLDFDITLKQLGIQDSPSPLSDSELSATLGMVVKSRSGIYHDSTAESDSMKAVKPARGEYQPGEFYYYNNWDFNLAGHLFERLSGQGIYDAFYKEIALPLNMQQYKNQKTEITLPSDETIPEVDGFYQYEPSASQYPAYHFRMSSHDLALYGQLFLNHGRWKGRQLLSKEWIDLSTKTYSVENQKYNLGYGILWKSIIKDENDKSRNAFYHTGVGVHMLGIYPKSKLVMVHRVDTEQEVVKFKPDNLYTVIRMMHNSRVSD